MFTTTLRVTTLSILVATLVAVPAFGTNRVPGNNGTLKVHEQGTPSQFIDNDPKVCTFNFEGYNFDKGQDGLIVITAQGGGNDRSEVKRIHMPATSEATEHGTYTETAYHTLPDGHYKSTVYGKDHKGEYRVDLKAKSKVFKVQCEKKVVNECDKPVNKPVETTKPTPQTPGNTQGTGTTVEQGYTSSTSTVKPQIATVPAVKGADIPEVLPATGASSLLPLATTLLAGAGAYATMLRRK